MNNDILRYIPLDKSWMIRMGILDILNGYNDIVDRLNSHSDLGGDMNALKAVAEQWNGNAPLNVGESATLYRMVRFALWKMGSQREIIREGTLKNRNICDNPDIVNWSLQDLLKLDNGTSQWASAAVLMGNKEKTNTIPYKLNTTYQALEHWNEQRKRKLCWAEKHDDTILNQAIAYLDYRKEEKIDFIPSQAEDYCFARAFGLITKEEGEKRWSSLKGHETNRIDEMERAIKIAKKGIIDSKDHRVVQALVMKYNGKIQVVNKSVVNKSWPKFWEFMSYSNLKEVAWKEVRDAMNYDKKNYPVYKAERLIRMAEKKCYGGFYECEKYVDNLHNAIHELLLTKDYKIIELENEIEKLRRKT